MTKKQLKEIARIFAGSLLLHTDYFEDERLSYEDSHVIKEEIDRIAHTILGDRKRVDEFPKIIDNVLKSKLK